VGGGLGVFLLLLFPDGRLPSVRWRYLAWFNAVEMFLGVLWVAFAPGPIDGLAPIQNPLGIDALEIAGEGRAADMWAMPWFIVVLVATTSVFVRLHGAGLEERQQIKWFAYAAVVLASAILFRVPASFAPVPASVYPTVEVLIALGLVSVSVATGVAILRYRLYEIDLLINRTLVYGLLTGTLAAIYFGGVAATEAIFRALTGQEEPPQLAIVVSTLVIAALFNPLRRRIQGFIDRPLLQKEVRRSQDPRSLLRQA
jgi:hypothetical protein